MKYFLQVGPGPFHYEPLAPGVVSMDDIVKRRRPTAAMLAALEAAKPGEAVRCVWREVRCYHLEFVALGGLTVVTEGRP